MYWCYKCMECYKCTGCYQERIQRGRNRLPRPPKIGKNMIFCVQSWFFTRNTPNIPHPPPLTWNPESAPGYKCTECYKCIGCYKCMACCQCIGCYKCMGGIVWYKCTGGINVLGSINVLIIPDWCYECVTVRGVLWGCKHSVINVRGVWGNRCMGV